MANGHAPALFLLKILGIGGLCLLAGVIGAALTHNFGPNNYTTSYADFISIMLTAVSVLMTGIAIFLALAGVIGWATIEQKVHIKTEEILDKGFKPGGAIEKKVQAFLAKGFEEGGQLNQMVADMVERKTEQTMFSGVQPVGDEEEPDSKNSKVEKNKT